MVGVNEKPGDNAAVIQACRFCSCRLRHVEKGQISIPVPDVTTHLVALACVSELARDDSTIVEASHVTRSRHFEDCEGPVRVAHITVLNVRGVEERPCDLAWRIDTHDVYVESPRRIKQGEISLRVSHKPVRLIRDLINTDSCDCICIVNPGGSRTCAGAWSVEFSDDSICVSHEATLFVCLAGVDESHDLAAIVDFGGKGIGRIGRIEDDERSIHISYKPVEGDVF